MWPVPEGKGIRVQGREKWVCAKWRGVEKCSGDVREEEVGDDSGMGGTHRARSQLGEGRSWWVKV